MEENLTDNEVIGEDWQEDFEITPAKLLNTEIHLQKDKAHKDFVDDLYRVCRRLATHQKPFLITNESSIDTLIKYLEEAESIPDYPPIVFNNIPKKFRSKELQMQLEKEPKTIREQLKKMASQVQKEKKRKEKVNTLSLGTDEIVPETIKEKAESFQQIKNFAAFDVFHCQADVRYKKKYKNEDYYGSEDFKLCFAFALRQMPKTKIREFLKYTLKKDFNSDKKEFSDFIKSIIDGYDEPKFFPSNLIKIVKDFLEDYLKRIDPIETEKEVKENNDVKTTELEPLEKPTHKQIVKALEFLLTNQRGFDFSENNFGLSNLLRLFHFITETPIPLKIKTSQSQFYRVWRDRRKTSTERQLDDLKAILNIFLSLKMDSTPIVESIKAEIQQLQSK